MKDVIAFLNYLLIGFRAWLAFLLFTSSSVSAAILGGLGAIAILTTLVAWIQGEPDLTFNGLVVGFGHLAILMFAPSQTHNQFIAPAFWLLVALQCWAKWHLGRRCTVSGPVWVSAITTGPYRFIRHPMTFTEMCIGCMFACEYPSLHNYGVLVVFIITKFVITVCEERFLLRQEAYRNYADCVKWRFIPGLW